eukprot:scaffold23.g4143.t1
MVFVGQPARTPVSMLAGGRAARSAALRFRDQAASRLAPAVAARRRQSTAAEDAETPSQQQRQQQQEREEQPPVNLASCVPRGELWHPDHLPERWVVFSDLHVSLRTRAVCLEVLERVHEVAAARQAGVAFLGDFWHLRGSLPVEPLNDVVTALAAWQQPMLMLAGNHDQVSLGGLTHSLTALAAANPRIHAFDAPAAFLGALWLPYRRDPAQLEAAIAAALGPGGGLDAVAGGGGEAREAVRAVFAHADVVGALMNEAYQAQEGLPPSLFPPGLPTYTGHYHRPHTVPGTRIRYVSRAEAGQQKQLLVVDRGQGWEVAEEIALDVGPRFFSAAAAPQQPTVPAEAAAAEAESADETEAQAQESYALELPVGLRAGDRLQLTLPLAAQKQHGRLLRSLQKQGIEVEVVSPPAATAAPRIGTAEGMGAFQLFSRYAEMQGLSQRATTRGLELLQGLEAVTGHALDAAAVSIDFERVELEGYFSFREPLSYELGTRGLVVVTGQVEDTEDAGPRDGNDAAAEIAAAASQLHSLLACVESNGAGKTALMMAPLWALTGDVDARAEGAAPGGRGTSGLTNADIVNEDAKAARVRVEGRLHGWPFAVERQVVRRGKGSFLTFHLDGEDLTTQEIRLTQQRIDAELGTHLLGRAVFYGQSDIVALMEANDRAFKDELGKLVDLQARVDCFIHLLHSHAADALATRNALVTPPLQVWAAAKEASGKRASAARGAAASCADQLVLSRQYLSQYQEQLAAAEAQAAGWEAQRGARAEQAERGLCGLVLQLGATLGELAAGTAALRTALGRVAGEGAALEGQLRELRQAGEGPAAGGEAAEGTREAALGERLQELAAVREQLRARVNQASFRHGAAQGEVVAKRRLLEEYQRLAERDLVAAAAAAGSAASSSSSSSAGHCSKGSGGSIQQGADDHWHDPGQPVCDRCLQPIDAELFSANQQRLAADVAAAEQEQQAALEMLEQLEVELHSSSAEVASAEEQLAEVRQQRAAAARQQAQEWQQVQQALSCARQEEQQLGAMVQQAEQCSATLTAWLAELSSRDDAVGFAASEAAADVPAADAGGGSGELPEAVERLASAIAQAHADLQHGRQLLHRLDLETAQPNPHQGAIDVLARQAAEEQAGVAAREAQHTQLEAEHEEWKQVDAAFRPTGIVNCVLEGVLGDLQEVAGRHLAALTSGLTLALRPCRPKKSDPDAVEKVVHVRQPGTAGEYRQRSVRQLSGGERRRVALALALGFSELAARRGRLRSNMLILDEHLDSEGCLRVAALLKSLPYSTVLAFDAVDVVVKRGGGSVLDAAVVGQAV